MQSNRKQTEMEAKKDETMQERLRVHYFYIRGKCQPIRHLLYYLNVDFEDIMHEKSSEVEVQVGFNMGLPMIEDGDLKIHDAFAIMTYLCRKYQCYTLIGLTPQTSARIQQVLMKYSMQRNKIFGIILQSLRLIVRADRSTAAEQMFKKLSIQCKFVQFCIRNIVKTKKFVLDTITLVDFIFYEICFYLCGFYEEYIKNHPYFKHVYEFKKNFEKLDFYIKNKDKIEQKFVFLEFNNPELNSDIQKEWTGSKENLIKRTFVSSS